jgi:hypothetical protein
MRSHRHERGQGTFPTEEAGVQMTLICTYRTGAVARQDSRHNGGYVRDLPAPTGAVCNRSGACRMIGGLETAVRGGPPVHGAPG